MADVVPTQVSVILQHLVASGLFFLCCAPFQLHILLLSFSHAIRVFSTHILSVHTCAQSKQCVCACDHTCVGLRRCKLLLLVFSVGLSNDYLLTDDALHYVGQSLEKNVISPVKLGHV